MSVLLTFPTTGTSPLVLREIGDALYEGKNVTVACHNENRAVEVFDLLKERFSTVDWLVFVWADRGQKRMALHVKRNGAAAELRVTRPKGFEA